MVAAAIVGQAAVAHFGQWPYREAVLNWAEFVALQASLFLYTAGIAHQHCADLGEA